MVGTAIVGLIFCLTQYVYNRFRYLLKKRGSVTNDWETRNVCRKTANSYLIGAISMIISIIIGAIFKI